MSDLFSTPSVTIGYKYFLGMHMILSHGPLDNIHRIDVDRRIAWEGLNTGGSIEVDAPELFGGEEREGGVSGTVDIEMGLPTQTPNSYLISVLGQDMPAFRGVAGAVLNQAYVGNNPYIKPWSFWAQRIYLTSGGEDQWYKAQAGIATDSDVTSTECLPYDCDNIETVILAHSDDLFTYGIFANNKPSANSYTYDESGNGHTWAFPNSHLGSSSFEDAAGAPIGCDDGLNILQVVSGNQHPLRVVPDYDTAHDGLPMQTGAILKQRNDSGSDEIPVLSIHLFRQPANAVALLWDRQAGTLRLYSNDNTDGVKYETLTLTAPPDNVWFYAGLYVNFAGKSAVVDLAYYANGELYNETIATSVRIESSYVPWNLGAACGFTNHNDIGYQVNYDYRAAWVFSPITEPVTGLGAAFLRSIQGAPLPASCDSCADMNPAHIIYECLTNTDWGMGYNTSDLDETSFTAAADTLVTEGMGISLFWSKEMPIEDFVGEILRHIDGVLYVSRNNGQFVLKLIREETVDSNTVVLDETNVSRITDDGRPTMGELTSSVTVNFHDNETDETGSVTEHNQALIQIQGAQTHTTIQYPGFSHYTIAQQAALRDLIALSTPFLSCKIYVSRVAEDLNVGDLFVLTWPDLDIDEVPMRVNQMSLGDGRDNTIVIDASEDIYRLPASLSGASPESLWSDPSEATPLPALPRVVMEAPYYATVVRAGEIDTNAILDNNADAGFLLASGGRQGVETNAALKVNTGSGYNKVDTLDFAPYAYLQWPIDEEETEIYYTSPKDLDLNTYPAIAEIGTETIRVDGAFEDSTGTYFSVGRGILDTVPQSHGFDSADQDSNFSNKPDDAIVFWGDDAHTDQVEYTASESIDVKIQTILGKSRPTMANTPKDTVVFNSRAIRPYPPGRLEIDGEAYPSANDSSEVYYNGAHTITWAHRDRLQQTDGNLYDHREGDIGPEAGTTYRVDIYSTMQDGSTSSIWYTENGITGTSHVQDSNTDSSRGTPPAGTELVHIKVTSIRDGYESWQSPMATLSYLSDSVGDSVGGLDSVGPDSVGLDSVGPWTPEMAGLELWLDASDTSTITESSGAVSQWDDKSGNARHATQGTAADKPTTGAATQNSLNVIRFDGTGDHLALSGLDSISGGASVFIVVKLDADPPAEARSGFWTITDGGDHTHITYVDSKLYESFGTTVRKSTGNPSSSFTSWRIYCVQSEDSSWESFVDSVSHYSTGTNTFGIQSSPQWLGRSQDAGNYYLDGEVAEMIITAGPTDLGDDAKQRIEGYLAHKWGITANLPGGHPYKGSPPEPAS